MSELETVAVATESTPASTEQAAPETAAPASGEATEAPSTPDSPDAELKAVWRKMNPDRETDGKFKSENAPEGDQKASDQAPTEGKSPSGNIPDVPVPQSWTAEAKALWEKVPPELRPHLAERETQAHTTITRQGQQIKAYEPLAQLVEQNRNVFERYGVDPKTGINQLLVANEYLERDPVGAIRDLAKAYGVNLNAAAGHQGQPGASPETAALQAEIHELRRQLQTTDHRVASREQQEAARQIQTLERQVEDFAKDKPDFSELADDVHAQIVALKTRFPELSPQETLQKAYEHARRVNPTVAARLEAEAQKAAEAKRIEEAKKRAAEAKKAAPLNVVSSPANSSTPRTMDDTLRDAAKKAFRR